MESVGEIGDGAANFDEAKVSAGRKVIVVDGLFEQSVNGWRERAKLLKVFVFHRGVGVKTKAGKAAVLKSAGMNHAAANMDGFFRLEV